MSMLLFALLAQAFEPGPLHLEVDAVMGMRAGGAVLATVHPTKHLEAGGYLYAVTDFYSMSPQWVRNGLDPKHNLRISPQAAVGVHTGDRTFQAALLGMIGPELLTFREQRNVPALDEPVTYGTTEVVLVGGLATDFRLRPWDHLGFNLLVYLPLPFTPTGAPNIERAHGALGVTWRL